MGVMVTATGVCRSLKPYLVSLVVNTACVMRYLLFLYSKAAKTIYSSFTKVCGLQFHCKKKA